MHKTSEWLQSFSRSRSSSQSIIKAGYRVCTKIAVTGGKGGVGKTSIALKMGRELSRSGSKVLLIDCDFNLSNTAIKLNLPIDSRFEKLLTSEISFEECIIQNGNFHLLPACNGSAALFESKLALDEIIMDVISAHSHEYDFIILDCPSNLAQDNLKLNAFCDFRFMTVSPDKSSITDSYSMIKLLSNKYNVTDNHLIVNMYQSEKQFAKVVQTISTTAENFLGCRTHLLGGIPKLDVPAEGFDTFFLSETKNEFNKNFVKLLYAFTEKLGEPSNQMAHEHDVH